MNRPIELREVNELIRLAVNRHQMRVEIANNQWDRLERALQRFPGYGATCPRCGRRQMDCGGCDTDRGN